MHRGQRTRLEKVALRVAQVRNPPGFAVVRCPIGEAWDELGPAEQERRIAEQLGRPSRADDFVMVIDVIPSGTTMQAA